MKICNILYTMIFALIFTSCENDIPFNVKNNPPKLVVNAIFDADSPENFIFLSKTGKEDIDSIYNATINIYVNDVLKDQLTEPVLQEYGYNTHWYYNPYKNKKYKTELRFNPGDKVKIEVFADNNKYHAWAEDIIPKPLEIDYIDTMTYIKDFNQHIRLKTTFTDPSNENNFYRLALVQNNTSYIKTNDYGYITTAYEETLYMDTREDFVLNDGKVYTENDILPQTENRFSLFNDSRLNGAYTMTTSFYRPVHYYHTPAGEEGFVERVSIDFKIHLISITEMQYYYLKAMSIISSDSYDEYLSTPVSFPSNVEGGVGFVGFSAGTHKTFSIPDIILRDDSWYGHPY